MDKDAIIEASIREIKVFMPFFVFFIVLSVFGATSRNSIAGNLYTKFYLSLFLLHLSSWIIIYVIFRSVIVIKRMMKDEQKQLLGKRKGSGPSSR
ncbi:MAG TPA: hypothetical protein PKY78_01150 [Candidatus Omnitrophota bacterium]|nr:hypothetical protein [Candidatus Omnitrophota bacterium]HPS19586.1 hypothetical protein [Candidatus Omnitrophota bacterium]